MTASGLTGKVALITGAGRGTGRALALKLGRAGVSVLVNDVSEAPARDCVDEILGFGGAAVACPYDIIAPDAGNLLVSTALKQFGQLDIIVNNASFLMSARIEAMSDSQFEALVGVNMFAPFRILRAAAPYFRDARTADVAEGREVFRKVVNVSSTLALAGGPEVANYGSTKAGLIGLTYALAKEWGPWKVNVNAVALGLIGSRMGAPYEGEPPAVYVNGRKANIGIPANRVEAYKARIALGRGGTPEEAAGAIYLLCLPEADFITGAVLNVSGGMAI
jgi:3-oxoacyl-[acyl-carrier protein] reductase